MTHQENNIVKEIIAMIADRIERLEPSNKMEDKVAEHELCVLIRDIGNKYGVKDEEID